MTVGRTPPRAEELSCGLIGLRQTLEAIGQAHQELDPRRRQETLFGDSGQHPPDSGLLPLILEQTVEIHLLLATRGYGCSESLVCIPTVTRQDKAQGEVNRQLRVLIGIQNGRPEDLDGAEDVLKLVRF
jgi:hypothetical protein